MGRKEQVKKTKEGEELKMGGQRKLHKLKEWKE